MSRRISDLCGFVGIALAVVAGACTSSAQTSDEGAGGAAQGGHAGSSSGAGGQSASGGSGGSASGTGGAGHGGSGGSASGGAGAGQGGAGAGGAGTGGSGTGGSGAGGQTSLGGSKGSGGSAEGGSSAGGGGSGGTAEGGSSGGGGGQGGSVSTLPTSLLAYDDFKTDPTSSDPWGLQTGAGWSTTIIASQNPGWFFHDEGGGAQWTIASGKPLTYANLAINGNYMAHHGDTAGRHLDPAAFPAYEVNGETIGKPGNVLWLSVLVRPDALGDVVEFATTDGDIPTGQDQRWAFGYDKSNFSAHWSLFKGGNSYASGVTASASTIAPAQGTTALLVVEFQFNNSSTAINLYVNPSALGGSAPAAADASITLAAPLLLRSFQSYGSDSDYSFDEIRFGTTFAAVTPTH